MSDEPEQDPNVCPRCGEPYNNADPASHACPETDCPVDDPSCEGADGECHDACEPPMTFQPDE